MSVLRISANEALRTRDCDFPNCDQEAESRSSRCRTHQSSTPPDPEVHAERMRRLLHDEPTSEPKKETPSVSDVRCRIEGCQHPSAGKGGSWFGLCSEHISIEGKRRQAKAKRTKGARQDPAAPPNQTTTTAEPPIATDPLVRIQQLEAELEALLAQVESKREELDGAARAYVDDLRRRYGIAA